MLIRRLFLVSLLPMLSAGWQAATHGAVAGRYIRVEAPVSQRFGLYEIEAIHSGKNLLQNDRSLQFAGLGHQGRDINFRDDGRRLVDGAIDRRQRSLVLQTAEGLNPWVEVDLGASRAIDTIKLSYPAGTGYADRGRRLVTVLDADRRVVFAQVFDIRDQNYRQDAELSLRKTPPPIGGREVPQQSAGWLPLAHVLELAAPGGHAARKAAFARRNETAQIKAFAEHFFRYVDLQRPELAEVARRHAAGESQAALDAFRDHFLDSLVNHETTWGHVLPRCSYPQQAEDLMNGVAVTLTPRAALGVRFEPGQIPWAYVPSVADADVDVWRTAVAERIIVNQLPRALLWEWAEGGDDSYLRRWAELCDDWAMHMTADVEQSPHNLRQYFVKNPLQEFNWLFVELAAVQKMRPELRNKLPSATLARVLLTALEEYGPAYWRQARKMVFNHTFNGLDAAYEASRVLDDFYAGQYLAAEVQRHFDRMWTYSITRDGSMIEVGDEGHMYMPLVTGRMFHKMQPDPPTWLTDAQRVRFAHGYATLSRYPIRHLAPGGTGHRVSLDSEAARIADLSRPRRTFKQGLPMPSYVADEIFLQPEVRDILDTVYGEGVDPDGLSDIGRQSQSYFADLFPGPYRGAPEYRSDWMPYAGLHYLRSGWAPDDALVHMLCQPGRGEANGALWNTQFRLHDHGYPLLRVEPLEIDRHKQDPLGDGLGQYPGSKTNRLTEASQKPLDARWLSSDRFDLAECYFEGLYRNRVKHGREQPSATAAGRVTRQVIQVRPLRLFLATDRIELTGDAGQQRDYTLPTVFRTTTRGEAAAREVVWDAARQQVFSANAGTPNVRLWHASAEPVSYTRSRIGSPRAPRGEQFPSDLALVEQPVLVRWRAGGADCIATLLATGPQQPSLAPETVEQLADEALVGFRVHQSQQPVLECRVARRGRTRLSIGRLEASAEALLLIDTGDARAGLALGVEAMWLDGRSVAVPYPDFEFELTADGVSITRQARRPIDPVEIAPATNVFIDRTDVTLRSATADVDIHYTLDGSDPTRDDPHYTGPLTLRQSSHVRARAFRRGSPLRQAPFSTAGVDVSDVSDAVFTRMQPLPARQIDRQQLAAGLEYEYLEDNWFRLFSHVDLLPATASGTTDRLFDVSMRATDGPFAVRYRGWLEVPETAVYTFHAPEEFVRNIAAPGYDLRLWIDGQEWNLAQTWHALGTWSVALEAGPHELVVAFADARAKEVATQRRDLWRDYPQPWVVWAGETPQIEISSPGRPRQPLPDTWLLHNSERARDAEAPEIRGEAQQTTSDQ